MSAFVVAYFPHLCLALGGLLVLCLSMARSMPAGLYPVTAGLFAAPPITRLRPADSSTDVPVMTPLQVTVDESFSSNTVFPAVSM